MNDKARMYRAVILRAAFGTAASELKVADMTQLNLLCEHLANCEEAQKTLRAKGYGRAGMTFMEVVRTVPDYSPGILKTIFRPLGKQPAHLDARELFDIWGSR